MSSSASAPRVYGEQYRASRFLGETNGVATLLGVDLADGSSVVIKTAAYEPETQALIENEFSSLRDIRSEWLPATQHLGHQDDHLYFVRSFVPGVNLRKRLAESALELAEALVVIRCVLAALRDAHDHGVLHRDVKPSNIIVDEAPPVQKAALIDFGLAWTSRLAPRTRDVPAGTASYMSPEQAGLIDQPMDERSDLYSAGIVLFECLAGRPPFIGKDLAEVLHKHVSMRPPELRDLGVKAPRVVGEVVDRLLRKDPDERYASAEAALAEIDEIIQALQRGIEEPAITVGASERRASLTEPAFVGREAELDRLSSGFEQAQVGERALILIEAKSGGGKTRLLEEFAHRCAQRGALVLWGQAYGQSASRPFQLFAGVADGILEEARARADLGDSLRSGLGYRAEAVSAVLPQLREILKAGGGGQDPEAHAEERTIDALTELLGGVGSSSRPALVLLDDCQWADAVSLKVLERWSRAQKRCPVMIVAAFRSEEVDSDHPLRSVMNGAGMELASLRDTEIERLVRSMGGAVPGDAIEVVVRLAEGSPFMAEAVMRGLVESGALAPDGEGWLIDHSAMAKIGASRRAAVLLAQRLDLLPEETVRLIEVAAVLGRRFDAELAATLSGLPSRRAAVALGEARHRQIVWTDAATGQYVFFHDRLREAALARLEENDRKDLHRRAALSLKSRALENSFDLAYHFDAAGEPQKALPFALAAARAARSRHALDVAEEQYRIAYRGATDDATLAGVTEGLGDVLMLQGRYDESETFFERTRDLVADRKHRALVHAKLGELASKRGDLVAAREAVEDGLRLLGRRVPRRAAIFVVRALWEILVQALHTALPRLFLARRTIEGADEELLAVRLYSRLAYVYWFQSKIPTLWAHLREMNLAERYPPTPELAQAYAEHAPAMTIIPLFTRGIAYAERSQRIREDLGDRWGVAQAISYHGVLLYGAGRCSEALEKCKEAATLFEHVGDRWERNIANLHVSYCLYRLGALEEAVRAARDVCRAGQEIGDRQARGLGMEVWAKASGGRVPQEMIQASLEDGADDVLVETALRQAEAVRLIARKEVSAAAAVLRQTAKLVRRKGLRQEYVAPVMPWLLTALRLQLESVPQWDLRRRRELLRETRRVGRRALRSARSYRNNRPQVLRDLATIASMRGRARRARKLFNHSIAAAELQGAGYEAAQSLLLKGRVGVDLGWAGAEKDIAAARAEFNEIEGPLREEARAPREPTLSLVVRFDSVLEAGRDIASALSPRAVYDAVYKAARALLRPDCCSVVEMSGDRFLPLAGDADGYGRSLIERALTERRSIVFNESSGDDPYDSLVVAGVRTAIAVPMFVRGQPRACLYADHRRIASTGEEEERLGAYIATLANAALENAEGFAEIQALSKTLEERVEQRTRELDQANKRLQQLDGLKNEFMAMVAHDMRTPLTVMSGFAATVRDRRDALGEERARELLDGVVRNAKRALEFVENLLEFARIESGEFSYKIRSFDLGQLVSRTVEELAAIEGADRFRVSLPADLPLSQGDEDRCWQVLTNLLSNAVKFSPPGSLVEVQVNRQGEELRVSVRDHGSGIEEANISKLFKKFSRLEGSDNGRPSGTGLGLYICRSMIEAQGGRIWAESQKGEGSVFAFTLPVAQSGPEPSRTS